MNQIDKEHRRTFESIRRQTEDGKECWSARDLARVLGYSEYRHFEPVIIRSKNACRNSGHPVSDYYEDALAMVAIGSGVQREVGAKVRKTISELGGAMPEDLPTPETSVKALEGKNRKQLEKRKGAGSR